MCFGPLRRVCHWGPLTAFAIIKSVSLMTVYCSRMWWPPESSLGGFLHMCLFLAFSALTIFNFLSAIYVGPGFLPPGWKPEKQTEARYLQNHGHFTAFLFFAVCGCIQAAVALACSLYHALHRISYIYYGDGTEPIITLSLTGLVTCVFCLGLAIGVVLAVGMLLYFQVRSILRNQTVVEDWIVEKAKYRRLHSAVDEEPFIFPYNLGRWQNIRQVINLTCEPVGDGTEWPVADGCNPFDLTHEQLMQKEEKRQRARKYEIVHNYSGAWLPVIHGFKTLICPPCSDEPRIKLKAGDTVIVTRWKKHWLFGELLTSEKQSGWRLRGWFPRNIAVDLTDSVGHSIVSTREERKKQ
ncbi:hypothetical protein B566_EDAN002673 [Ephemera danica]|nr:hypothetical protein B566_EDAN002673 [Ephemera danica]